MESGPENSPAEERIDEWWICTDWPGPVDEPEGSVPLNVEVNINKSNWHNYDLYKHPPHKDNYLLPGTKLYENGKLVGTVRQVEVQTFFSGAGTQHFYTVESIVDWPFPSSLTVDVR